MPEFSAISLLIAKYMAEIDRRESRGPGPLCLTRKGVHTGGVRKVQAML